MLHSLGSLESQAFPNFTTFSSHLDRFLEICKSWESSLIFRPWENRECMKMAQVMWWLCPPMHFKGGSGGSDNTTAHVQVAVSDHRVRVVRTPPSLNACWYGASIMLSVQGDVRPPAELPTIPSIPDGTPIQQSLFYFPGNKK